MAVKIYGNDVRIARLSGKEHEMNFRSYMGTEFGRNALELEGEFYFERDFTPERGMNHISLTLSGEAIKKVFEAICADEEFNRLLDEKYRENVRNAHYRRMDYIQEMRDAQKEAA